MKKALKIIGKILLGLLVLLIAALLILFIYHRIMLNKEDELLKNYPGEIVEVDGHNMNVYAEGEGSHTLVFLAPAGDTSPALTFKPIYSNLNDKYKTVVIEKFGYGMSDIVDSERDYETMVDECREALSKAEIEAPYILCPYSKSGLDALLWAQKYPDEVEAVVGIDMAFPNSYDEIEIPEENSGSALINILKNMGVIRFFVTDGVYPDIYSSEDKALLRAIDCRKYGNDVFFNEMIKVPDACNMIISNSKPDIPMYLFLTNGEGTVEDIQKWQGFAKSYVEGMENITITELDSGHGEIIFKETEQICEEVEKFVENLNG